MGYFSNLAQAYIECDNDRTYPSPEKQLLWRLEDLNYRLKELIKKDAPYRGWKHLNDNEIRYTDPDWFENIADVERAIELACEDLQNDEHATEFSGLSRKQGRAFDAADERITLSEIIQFPSQPTPLKAA